MMESSLPNDQTTQNLPESLNNDLHILQQPHTTTSGSFPMSSMVLTPPSALPQFTLSGSPLLVPAPDIATGPTPMPLTAPSSLPAQPISIGPPPKSGFQPVSHPSPAAPHSPPASLDATPPPPAGSVGVNLFTPHYDPNSVSLYSQSQASAYQPTASPNAPPGAMASPYEASSSISIPYDELAEQGYHRNTHLQDPNSFLDWLKHNETVQQVVEKAKVGVQAMITTMDPQMRDVLYSGGDINVIVASGSAVKIEAVKEAFQKVFGRATVSGHDSQPGIAPQPVGFSSGVKGAEERIETLRRSAKVSNSQVCVAVESFIVDLADDMWYDIAALVLKDPVNNITLHAYSQPTPVTLEYVNQAKFETPKDYSLARWYDIAALVLKDPVNNITLHAYSQPTPVTLEYVNQAKFETPKDYSLARSGLAVTIGQVIQRQMGLDSSNWHYYFGGFARLDLIYNAAKQLAFLYKQKLPNQN